MAVAHAQDPLADADRAYAEGRLEDAFAAYTEALQARGNSSARLHRLHLQLGVLAAVRGDLEGASGHFRVVRAIDPETAPPSELNPELRRLFESAGSTALRLELSAPSPSRGALTSIEIAIEDPLRELVDSLRAVARVGETMTWEERVASTATEVRVAASAWREGDLTVTVEALDANEGVLASEAIALHAEAAPVIRPEPVLAPTEAPSEPSLWPWLLLGGGIAVLAAGLAIGLGVALSDETFVLRAPQVVE
jgi:hypothetical protein